MFCPHCGGNIVDDSLFCPNCGKQIAQPNASVSPQLSSNSPTTVDVQPRRKGKRVLKGCLSTVIGLVLVLILLMLLIPTDDTNTPEPSENPSAAAEAVEEPQPPVAAEKSETDVGTAEYSNREIKKLAKSLDSEVILSAYRQMKDSDKSALREYVQKYFLEYLTKDLKLDEKQDTDILLQAQEIAAVIPQLGYTTQSTAYQVYQHIDNILLYQSQVDSCQDIYTGPINENSFIVELDVYINSRIGNSQHVEIGGISLNDAYLDEYMITGYSYLADTPWPDGDWQAVLRTDEAVQSGIWRGKAVVNGSGQYVDGQGFEMTLDIYQAVSEEEIQRYYDTADNALYQEIYQEELDAEWEKLWAYL